MVTVKLSCSLQWVAQWRARTWPPDGAIEVYVLARKRRVHRLVFTTPLAFSTAGVESVSQEERIKEAPTECRDVH